MLRRFCSNGWGAFTAAETAAVEQLCNSHRQLLMDGGFADVRSEAGYTACAVFLTNIDKTARVLCLEVAPRAYRASFSANYRALFPDNARHYRVDVLEASVDQHSAIWVNGDKFELSAEAIHHAEALQHAWGELGVILDRWHTARTTEPQNPAAKPTRADLATALVALDMAWAQFECKYISELIAIEEQARQLIVKAVNYEAQLRMLHNQMGGPEYQEVERHLVRCIAHLNSVANFKRKGRDDLGCDILDSAKLVMQRCREGDGFAGAAREAAEVLASDVIASYEAMRNYLCEVGTCIERVDPHLCNNVGLVSRLVDWEESWEVGARYVRHAPLCEAVCGLVSEIRAAQAFAPALTAMCEDCDVELFLVLPRVVLLCFVADPSNMRAELVRSLLPHRFVGPADCHGGATAPAKLDPELRGLAEQFIEAMRLLGRTVASSPPKDAAWEVIVKRAIQGPADAQEMYGGLTPATQKAVEEFMREVERWSLELQRHCPEDWNQFSAVLVQCLTGGSQKQPSGKFQV